MITLSCHLLQSHHEFVAFIRSVYRALEMLEDGATASSDNKAELDRLLGPRQLRDEVKALQEFDTTDGDVQLNMATSIWADELKESFVDHMIDAHDSEVFDLPTTYEPVDDWIEEKTNGMIKKLMGDDQLDQWTRALLVDAVYFKGTWAYSFDPKDNVEGVFHDSDTSKTDVTFMKASREMEAVRASPSLGDAAFVALDYGKSAEFTAIFVLPKTSDPSSMQEVVDGLNTQPLSELLNEANGIPVQLKLPRFHLNFGPIRLKPVTQNMGIETAFDENIEGKFNRMSFDPLLYVDDIYHGACMDVNEEGTVAAAATVVVVNTRSQPRVTPFQLTFDRPFVVTIFHRTSGVPLFIARVMKPDFA
jgi:serine protease inhibitor